MNNQPKHAFIFDMDGTLVDNMPIHNQVWIETLTETGQKPDPHTFNDLTAGKTNPEILRMFFGDEITDDFIQAFADTKEGRYRNTYRDLVQPLPGALEFLDKTRQAGIALGLATSAGHENIRLVLDGGGLAEFFPIIVNGDMIERGKPDPEIFLKTAERLGVEPDHCLVFEDSRGGIEAARRAGMPVVAVTTLLTKEQALQIPGVRMAIADYQNLDPQELLQFVL